MAAAYDVVEETAGGYAKVEYKGIGTEGYRDLNADEPTSQQAFAGSRQQEEYAVVRDRKTGRFLNRVPQDDVVEVSSGVQDVGGGHGFSLNVDIEEGRSLMHENPDKWDAFQVFIEAEYKCDVDGDVRYTFGWSKVADDLSTGEFRRPILADGSPEAIGWETVPGDSLDMAHQEAVDNAWSKIPCSPEHFEIINEEVKIYAGKQSDWAIQARNQTHILL